MLRTNGVLHVDSFPWIFLQLLDAQRHLALVAVQSEDHSLHLVANLQELLSAAQVLAPRHLADVDQTLDTRLNLYECTVVGDDNHLAGDLVAHLQVLVESIPRMRSELLQTQSDALLLLVEVEDNNIDLLVELDNLLRIVDAAPAQVGDMDESVHTAQVDEYAVRGDVLHGTLQDLALLQLRDNLLLLSLELLLDESLVRNDHIAELLVDLHHLELHRLTNELVVVAYGMNVNLRAGQESLDAEHVDDHTTLCAALDEALDHLLLVESLIHAIPSLRQACLLVRKQQLTLAVLSALHVDLHHVALFQVGVVAEFSGGDDTIALVANVDNNFFLVNADDLAIHNLMVGHLVQGFVVGLVKLFLAYIGHGAFFKLVPVKVLQRLNVLC